MPKESKMRHGSLQFWPRRRAKRAYARVRSWAKIKDANLNGFPGYKVGMTHLITVDNRQYSKNKGKELFCPVTVVECPPIKIISARFYKQLRDNMLVSDQLFAGNLDKDLKRKITVPKKTSKKIEDIKEFDDIRALVQTQPRLTGIGKKKPELFEIGLGGKKEDKLNFIKENLGKEIQINRVFKEGQQLDSHAITKGKGVQGPVKRFGIGLRQHKSEKARRNPGSLGPWCAQGTIMWRVAHAGKTGYNQRTEYNKLLVKIGNKPEEIIPKGGFLHYGVIKNQYMLIKGSLSGPAKRLIIFTNPIRANKHMPKEAPSIKTVATQ